MDAYISANLCKDKGVKITEVMNTKEVDEITLEEFGFYLFIH